MIPEATNGRLPPKYFCSTTVAFPAPLLFFHKHTFMHRLIFIDSPFTAPTFTTFYSLRYSKITIGKWQLFHLSSRLLNITFLIVRCELLYFSPNNPTPIDTQSPLGFPWTIPVVSLTSFSHPTPSPLILHTFLVFPAERTWPQIIFLYVDLGWLPTGRAF